MKIKKKKNFLGGGWVWGGGGFGPGWGGCEQRSEAFVKIQKKNCFLGGREEGGSGWRGGVRVDVNEEVKFL